MGENMLTRIKNFFSKLFHTQKNSLTTQEEKDVEASLKEIRQGKAQKFRSADELIKDLHTRKIAEKNVERQKSTLGYGLKSRNFKPRPAHEMRTFDIRKKPEDN